jgi:hypothetical protein
MEILSHSSVSGHRVAIHGIPTQDERNVTQIYYRQDYVILTHKPSLNFYSHWYADPSDPGSVGIHTYVFTVESQQLLGARHTSCTQLLWKPHGHSKEDTIIYLVNLKPRESWGQGTLHVRNYWGIPTIWAAKARTFK